MDKEKSSASIQFPLVRPTTRKTVATMTTMMRIISQVKAATPRSKLVGTGPVERRSEIEPK